MLYEGLYPHDATTWGGLNSVLIRDWERMYIRLPICEEILRAHNEE